jgi:hypothetical protein
LIPEEGSAVFSRRTAAAFAALFLLRAAFAAHFYIANLGFTQVFGDDCFNILESLHWLQHPVFWVETSILPMGFWVLGLGLKLSSNVLLVPIVLNTLLSLAIMAATAALTRKLFPRDDASPVFAAAFAGFHPVFLVQGMGALLEFPLLELFTLLGCLFFLYSREDGKQTLRLPAALCFAAASLTRYDGWFPGLIFSGFLLAEALRCRREGKNIHWSIPLSILIVCLPPAAWIDLQGWTPWSILRKENSLRLQDKTWTEEWLFQIPEMFVRPLHEMLSRFTSFLLLPAAAALLIWTDRDISGRAGGLFSWICRPSPQNLLRLKERMSLRWEYSSFILGQFLFLAPLPIMGIFNPFCHCTHFNLVGLLLAPWAARSAVILADAAGRYARSLRLTALLTLLLAAFLSGFPRMFSQSGNYSPGMIKLCAFLHAFKKTEGPGASGRILIELHKSEKDARGLFWESQLPLILFPPLKFTKRTYPDSQRILFDRDWTPVKKGTDMIFDPSSNPSLLEGPPDKAAASLRARDVILAAVRSDDAMRLLTSPAAGLVRLIDFGDYHLLAFKDDPKTLRAAARAIMGLPRSRGVSFYRSRSS